MTDREQLGIALNEFTSFLQTMTAINEHQGYQFTQVLMVARDNLKKMQERYASDEHSPGSQAPVGGKQKTPSLADGTQAVAAGQEHAQDADAFNPCMRKDCDEARCRLAMAEARLRSADAQDVYRPHHCKHGTRGVYCFDFHPSHEREKCDAARDVAHAELKVQTQQDSDDHFSGTCTTCFQRCNCGTCSCKESNNGER